MGFSSKQVLDLHIKKQICAKFDKIQSFNNEESFNEWKIQSVPKYFSQRSGDIMRQRCVISRLYCNNNRPKTKAKARATNFVSFVRRNTESCTGQITIKKYHDGDIKVFSKNCSLQNHIQVNPLKEEIQKKVVKSIKRGMNTHQIRQLVLIDHKKFLSRHSINNLRYKFKINMGYRTSTCEIASLSNMEKQLFKVHSNINSIKNIKELVLVFQTKEMNLKWAKDAVLFIDSTHKITK